MNTCAITSNLGADPESFYTSEGSQIVTFHLAFRSGKDKTSWIKVSCFNKLAELAAKCLHKGARVGVIASLDQQKWTGEDGSHKSSFRLIARALRSYTNIGMTCLEELAELEEVLGEESAKTRPKPRKEPKEQPKPKPAEQKGDNEKREPAQKKDPPEKGPEGPKETPARDPKANSGELPKPSTAQIRAIEKLAERRGISAEELSKKCQEMFGTLMGGISAADASSFIRSLQQSA